jgi:hypothetical protein
MISSSTPSVAAVFAASSRVETVGPYPATVTWVGVGGRCAPPPVQRRRRLGDLGLRRVVEPLRLDEDHRIVVGDGLLDHPVRVGRVGARDHLESGGVREVGLHRLAVVLDRADPATGRDADRDRHLHQARRPVVELGDLADDLVEAGEHEAVELDLAHRPVATDRQTHRGADDPGFGEWGVDHPGLAEILLQAVGDAKDAAELADVLTHDHNLGVGLHRLAQAVVEGFRHRRGRAAHRSTLASAPHEIAQNAIPQGPCPLGPTDRRR